MATPGETACGAVLDSVSDSRRPVHERRSGPPSRPTSPSLASVPEPPYRVAVTSAEDLQARKAQAAWLRRRAYWWLFWALLGLGLLFARFFILPYFDVASSQWPSRTLALALLLLVGGGIQWKLTLRRANAIAGGASSGQAFTEIQDQSAIAPIAGAVEEVATVASEL